MPSINISQRQYLECVNLHQGVFNPVNSFMTKEEIESVSKKMVLPNNKLFPLPIFFDFSEKYKKIFEKNEKINLIFNKKEVGYFMPTEIFVCNKKKIAKRIFGYTKTDHPGVRLFYLTEKYFAAGKVKIENQNEINFFNLNYSLNKVKKIFKRKRWKKIVGFQTRNIPHLGHEYILKNILDNYDGVFINPLVGSKKKGDFTNEAIVKSYKTLIKRFYSKKKILFCLLTTSMRYAGPKEAIFHAIIRKNFGCSHFLIGRDHAGVGNFYGDYDAHKLVKKIENKINVKIIKFKGPFFCKKCKMITNENFCKHYNKKELIIDISGTDIRKSLKNKRFENCQFVRKEVINSIKKINLFL